MKNIYLYLFCLTPVLLLTGPFLPGVSVSVIGLYGIYCLKKIKIIKENKILINFLIIFLFFYIYLLLISYNSINPEESFKSSLFYFRFTFFSLGSYFLLYNLKEKTYTLIGYSIFCSFLIVFVSLLIEIIFNFFSENPSIDGQITGIFFSEKIAGSYISKLYPLGIGIIYFCDLKLFKLSKKDLIQIFFLVSLFSVLVSGERTSIAIFLISNTLLIIGLSDYRQAILNKKNILLIFILFIFLILTVNSVFERIVHKTISQISEDNQINIFSKHHESHLKTAYKMFDNNKIFGIGPRMFRFLCDDEKYEAIYDIQIQYNNNGTPKYKDNEILIKEYNGCSTHPHNLFFQLLSETGLIGITFYSFFLFSIFIQLYESLVEKKNLIYDKNKIILFTILTCLFSSLFPFLPSNNFFGSYINIFYYFIITFYFIEKNETR
jgi:O-antigen ligase